MKPLCILKIVEVADYIDIRYLEYGKTIRATVVTLPPT